MSQFGNTALMKAACRGHWGTTKLLLEKGAKREATDGVRGSGPCRYHMLTPHYVPYIHTQTTGR